ncbi:50S ribosomal protein L18Ae [Methanothermobacter tenebrarum]|uniref:Large ribosomal subunit protein eL20 n=1 Tax=Methanothermobacter tenebrarum TaxID=680118 RepID=A0A328PBW2_9EURY|nr:50S ribosomal protein L18Ae [Methanothermobacter tenebrarum]MBC7100900.1 50S ribosomal protein L18a [Methanobacteriales archaeon]MBC7118639.1 50S ribosomal protein L18a [Methanobacteriaceae archaeon]NPV64040.1 50S ribosomal protein L18a [Methanobacteriaceae archaeon]RAO79210.1 50S ribosomal protein L18a [Methanothermobacter tenebrarum]
MKTRIFRVKGNFMMGEKLQPFTKELKAIKKEEVYEKIYSEFGSKHGIGRNRIYIKSIEEISPDEVEDPILKAILEA